jgi:murein L,D-transpeptidase YcbB/YkuD
MLLRGPIAGAICLLAVSPGLVVADALLRGTAASLREAPQAYVGGVPLLSPRLIAELYHARGHAPAWNRADQVEALLHAVEQSPSHGLRPEDFHVATLRELTRPGALEQLHPRERVSAELRLSDALLRYVHHIRFGKLDPVAVNREWNHRPPIPAERLVEGAEAVLSAPDPAARLAALAPKPYFYEQLRDALREQLAAEHLRNLAPIPGGQPLGPGSRDGRVTLLRDRLRALGEPIAADPPEPGLFDAELVESVITFQRRNGLSPDGVVGAATLAALNRPYDPTRADRIRINLERMRWFYDDLPPDYVLVDVAGFMVHVVRGGEVIWSTRAVVGTPEHQTPSFRDEVEHLVFNPTWTVPPSIQKKMRGVSSQYKVVDRQTGRRVSGGNISDHRRYLLVQEAGPKNALGRVKFMFPNGHAIYLHDTPSKGLFGHGTRAYSHGCVRVQNPLKLAEVILDKPSWDQAGINRILETNKTRYVHLDGRLPIILYYLTAKADAEGHLSLRRDLYGRDGALERAFGGPASPIRIHVPEPQGAPDQPAPLELETPRQAQAVKSQPQAQPASTSPRQTRSSALTLEVRPGDLSPQWVGDPDPAAPQRANVAAPARSHL